MGGNLAVIELVVGGTHPRVQDGKVSERGVSLGPLYANVRVIRSGLGPDDRVVIDGVQRAKPGSKVTVRLSHIPTPTPPAAPAAEDYTAPVSTGAAPADIHFPAQ